MEDDKTKISKEKELAVHYMETLIDVVREPILILDADLRVITASPVFYADFQVTPEATKNILLYNLGNGQWNIADLKKLLDEILPEKKMVKDYEVTHNFETIGQKTILLNASQIDSSQLIILAMEDITVRNDLEHKLADYTKGLEVKVDKRTEELSARVKELETLNKTMVGRELRMVELKKEIESLKKLPK